MFDGIKKKECTDLKIKKLLKKKIIINKVVVKFITCVLFLLKWLNIIIRISEYRFEHSNEFQSQTPFQKTSCIDQNNPKKNI